MLTTTWRGSLAAGAALVLLVPTAVLAQQGQGDSNDPVAHHAHDGHDHGYDHSHDYLDHLPKVAGPLRPFTVQSAKPNIGKIKGKVRKPNEKPLKGITVHAFHHKRVSVSDYPIASAVTNKAGKYKLRLPRGKYRVLADGNPKLRDPKWFPDKGTVAGSKKFKIRAGTKHKGVKFKLDKLEEFIPPAALTTPRPSTPNFSDFPLDPISGYEPQTKCRTYALEGTLILRQLVLDTYGDSLPAYLNRPCGSDTSEHYDGRAIDWMVDSRDLVQGSRGDAFVNWLLATRNGEPAAMARRLGVMYLGWRGRIWGVYRHDDGWREIGSCNSAPYRKAIYDNGCHRNHIHISLNKDGGKARTSWYEALD